MEYDLGKSHRNPVDPETEVIEILFIYESGDGLSLRNSFWNNTGLATAEWILLRNRMCYYLRRRMYEIRIEGSLTKWPRTKWFFEREMEWMNQRCRAQMSWDNYGRDGWHIDHLRNSPIANSASDWPTCGQLGITLIGPDATPSLSVM
jgi:hypothetical protein